MSNYLSNQKYNQVLKRLIGVFLIFVSLFFLSGLISPQVKAQTEEWSGVCVGPQDNGAGDVATIQGLECLIANIFTVFITLLGLAGFVMFLVAGVRWLTSGGNSKGIETAKNTMTFAVVGLVVALSAFIVINLIADFTGVNVIRKFVIPAPDTEWQ